MRPCQRFGVKNWAAALLLASAACTPDIATDPVPAVMQFEPTMMPARVPEPSALAINPGTGKVDLAIAGVVVPADCTKVTEGQQAQCEFNQYLQSLDGFPTTAPARAPVSEAVDLATITPANVSVVVLPAAAAPVKPAAGEVVVGASADGRYIQVLPVKPWPVGTNVFIGVRGYEGGIRAGGKTVVASTTYNLLKREESLTCTEMTAPEAVPASCKFLTLLTQQMAEAMARGSLATLEGLRRRMAMAWPLMEGVGGIPKKEAAMLWTFPIHKASVIDGLPVPAGADEIRLAVNGPVDPATVSAFRPAEEQGSVILMNLKALMVTPLDLAAAFPSNTSSFADGQIVIKAAAPLEVGGLYGIAVTKQAKNPAGQSLVPSPITVLLMARGPVVDATGRITVSSLSDQMQAMQLEGGRQQLRALLDNESLAELTGLRREQLAYLIAIPWGVAP